MLRMCCHRLDRPALGMDCHNHLVVAGVQAEEVSVAAVLSIRVVVQDGVEEVIVLTVDGRILDAASS
jgi:hypothetical protein